MIFAKLAPLSEQPGIVKSLKNVDHADSSKGFAQDSAYVVTDYQVRGTPSVARVA